MPTQGPSIHSLRTMADPQSDELRTAEDMPVGTGSETSGSAPPEAQPRATAAGGGGEPEPGGGEGERASLSSPTGAGGPQLQAAAPSAEGRPSPPGAGRAQSSGQVEGSTGPVYPVTSRNDTQDTAPGGTTQLAPRDASQGLPAGGSGLQEGSAQPEELQLARRTRSGAAQGCRRGRPNASRQHYEGYEPNNSPSCRKNR